MGANLVRPPRFQPATHQRGHGLHFRPKGFFGFHPRNRVLAAITHHRHALSIRPVPRDIA